jgi:PIN domain nuclease of toxin-antitoxin system
MRAVADTHVAIWYLWEPKRLSLAALTALDTAAAEGDRIGLSAITLCEVVYLSEKGRLRKDAPDPLEEAIQAPDALFDVVALDARVASQLRRIPRAQVPEMPDRVIAATSLAAGLPLITKDKRIRESGVPTIW